MKTILKKQLITTGKMPDARAEKMNIFGTWLFLSFTVLLVLALQHLSLALLNLVQLSQKQHQLQQARKNSLKIKSVYFERYLLKSGGIFFCALFK